MYHLHVCLSRAARTLQPLIGMGVFRCAVCQFIDIWKLHAYLLNTAGTLRQAWVRADSASARTHSSHAHARRAQCGHGVPGQGREDSIAPGVKDESR